MKYLLDTNAVIALLNGNATVNRHLRQRQPGDIGLSAIVAHELYYGAYKSRRQDENVALLDGLQFEIVDFDLECARAAGEIRARLTVAGTPIGPYDVLIAGQAWSRGLILVTRNSGEFARVTGLKLENWEVGQ